MKDLTWNSGDGALVLSVATASLCFCVYWFVAHSSRFKELVEERRGKGYFARFGALYQKGVGMVCLGLIPATVGVVFMGHSLNDLGVREPAWESTLYWIFLLGGVLSFLPWYSARQEEMQAFYPQVRVPIWNRNLLLVNALIWTLYLAAYEFMFRGFLLMSLVEAAGWWPAITITTALSTVTHIPKGNKETFGTIPMSVVLCFIVYQTGSIWACIVVHAILAISNDYWAAFYHPRMQFRLGYNGRVKKPVID